MSELALKLIQENKRKYSTGKDATFLDLGNCGLRGDLPKELFDCTWLTRLNFGTEYCNPKTNNDVKSKNIGSHNRLNAFSFDSLQKLERLQSLSLRYNLLRDLKPLTNLVSLRSLDVSCNEISNWSALATLRFLKSLDLRGNQILDLSPIIVFDDLNELSVRDNKISGLEFLTNLQALKWLDISHNQVSDLSPLANLVALKFLNIHLNQISDLSTLAKLVALDTLYMGDNLVSDLSPLANLTALKTLHNSTAIVYYSGKTRSEICSNKISDLSPLKNLRALTNLYMGNNQINDLSPLSNLIRLNTLDIRYNQIKNLKSLRSIANLPNLREVYLLDNPVVNRLPAEVVNAGWQAIKYRLLNEERLIPFKDLKVLLLGNTNIGKTNLLQYLETGKEPNIMNSTHGVQYKTLNRLFKNITLHCWDFGGQEYFHATHKLFFSPGALHIIMWSKNDIPRDSNYEECYDLNYWLRCIEQLTPREFRKDIEVIIAENKLDLNGYKETLIDQVVYKNRFKNIQFEFTSFNLKPIKKLKGFKELLHGRIEFLVTNQQHPLAYKNYLDLIKASDKKALTILEIDGNNPERVQTAMRVFHNMGILLYFNEIIADKVFIKPDALLGLLYKKILGVEKRPDLNINEIEQAVKGNELELTTTEVTDLLKYFNLVFQIHETSDVYFIPQYLKPASHLVDFIEKHDFRPANIRIESDHYLMSSAMASVFAEYGRHVKPGETQDYLFWKDGIIIEKDGSLLMIKFNRAGQYIELFPDAHFKNFRLQNELVDFIINSPDQKKESLSLTLPGYGFERSKTLQIKNNIDWENDIDWESEKFSIWVSLDGKFFSNWVKLLENSRKGILQIEAVKKATENDEMDIQTEVKYLLTYDYRDYLPKKERDRVQRIPISYSEGNYLSVSDKPKVFFSYAWDGMGDKLVTELYNSLKKDGYEVVRDKNNLGYKGLISEFMKSIGAGDFIVTAINDKYLRSEYCMFELFEIFRNSKFEKAEFVQKIFPIWLEPVSLNDVGVRDGYYDHWFKKKNEWRDHFRKFAAGQENLTTVEDIDWALRKLIPILSDVNASTKETLLKNNFSVIKKAIEDRIQK